MTTYAGNFPNRPFRLEFSVNVTGQNVEENWSDVTWDLWIFRNSASTSWSNNRSSWSITLDGQNYSGTFTYDFRNTDRLRLSFGTKRVYHNSDGGKQIQAFAGATVDLMGSVSLGVGDYGLPFIPRATVPNFTPDPIQAGQTLTINTPRASDQFVHTIELIIGNFSVMFARNIATQTTYIVPLEVMNQIPNSTRGIGIIRVGTYVGNTDNGRWIGTIDRGITIDVPSGVQPDFTSLTYTDQSSTAVSTIGALVQGVSRLAISVVGAKGAYGSSIVDSRISLSGITLVGLTGTMPTPITTSGTVTISTTITDSRGRTRTKTSTITVLAYKPPVIASVSAQRATSAGVVNEDGANLRINVNVSISPLTVGGTQKNAMNLRIKTRVRGDTTWVTKVTSALAGSSYNSYQLLLGYDIQQAWEVQVEILDYFATSAIMVTVATSNIFMHWDARIGVGIGKYRQKGMLDVKGDIYHRDGSIVQPAGMVIAMATLTAPDGWLICNGGTVSRTTYAGLFAAIGTLYGAGDGSTTFNLPSLRGRSIVGVDPGQTEFTPQGKVGGSKTISLNTDNLPSHSHFTFINQGAKVARQDGSDVFGATLDGADYTSTSGKSAAFSLMSPYQALLYVIKT